MLIGLFGIVLVVAGDLIITKSIDYRNMTKSESYSHTVTLTWKQVKDFYRINHDRWTYRTVRVPSYRSMRTKTKALLYDTGELNRWYESEIVRIHLGPISWMKFKMARIFNKNHSNPGMELFLDSIQDDIDKIRKKSEQEIEESNEKMEELLVKMTSNNSINCGLRL